MPVCPFILPFWFAPLTFGDRPNASAVRTGASLFRARKGPQSVWQGDEVSVGNWFDGRKKSPIEKIVWLSPLAVSRRLGYLQAQEGWTDADLHTRWSEAREFFGTKLCFVAQLCAFPKNDLWEEGMAPSAPTLCPLAPSIRIGGKPRVLEQVVLEDRAAYERKNALPDWIAHPAFRPIQGVLDAYEDPGFASGPYRSRLLLLWCPAELTSDLQLVLATQTKQRLGVFQVLHTGKRRRSR